MTAQYYEQMTPEEKTKLQSELILQSYLERVAEIDYQCYFLKINRSQFYDIYLWKRKVKRT